ncbi:MAG: hypothetical protein RI989_1526 [Bacteroidota bacterium]
MSKKIIVDQEVNNNEAHASNTTSNFFEKYRKPLMAVGIALVVGVGGYFAYDATIAQPREREAAMKMLQVFKVLSITTKERMLLS